MSEWYAVDALNESIDRTEKLLFKPFNLKLWLKIGLIVFLLNVSQFAGQGARFTDMEKLGVEFTGEVIILLLAVMAVILFLTLVLSFVEAVFSFVFIEALMEGRVEFVNGFKRNASRGLYLFLFRLVTSIIVLGGIVVLVAAGAFAAITINSELFTIAIILVGILLLIPIMIASGLFFSLTQDFVVPLMFYRNDGVVSGWRRLIGLLSSNLSQFIVYVIIKIAFGMIAGIISLVIALLLFGIILVASLVIGGGSVLAWLGLTAAAPSLESLTVYMVILGAILFVALLIAVQYTVGVITLPIEVFFRYYSLFFIQNIDGRNTSEKTVQEAPKAEEKASEVKKQSKRPKQPKDKDKSQDAKIKAY